MIARLRRGARDERGAMAIMVSFLALVLFGMAALAVDVSMVGMERQKLHDTVDSAAHAGAYNLPGDGAGATAAALNLALADDAALTGAAAPSAQLYCVVASKPGPLVNTGQIPSTCYPGPGPYTVNGAYGFGQIKCNASICAIPCTASASTKCNTVKVVGSKVVPFRFAPVIGRDQGTTGSVASAACKGSCGAEVPNPMDVVILADRTYSMSTANRLAMVDGIEGALKTMNPAMHYVALGALHKSVGTDNNCLTAPYPGRNQNGSESDSAYKSFIQTEIKKGMWVPVPFSNDYLTTAVTPTLNTTSRLAKAVDCIRDDYSPIPYRTHLASALKGAARYLLGKDPNNLASLPSTREGTVKKVIIFETDGKPQEVLNQNTTGLSLNTPGDMGVGGESDSQIKQACKNFTDIATETKSSTGNPIIITIGFGEANTARCGNSTTHPYVRDALAAAASPHPGTGAASVADSDCSSVTEKTYENGDGDFYFCASNGSELGPIFTTAISSLTTSIKLISLP